MNCVQFSLWLHKLLSWSADVEDDNASIEYRVKDSIISSFARLEKKLPHLMGKVLAFRCKGVAISSGLQLIERTLISLVPAARADRSALGNVVKNDLDIGAGLI